MIRFHFCFTKLNETYKNCLASFPVNWNDSLAHTLEVTLCTATGSN